MSTDKLGQRLNYFRKRAGISQFDLELKLGLSSGVISRIQSGKVNPTKETLLAIASVLKMNSNEIDYVMGRTSTPATDDEIALAYEEVGTSMESKLSYIVDERWRLCKISKKFGKLMGLTDEEFKQLDKKVVIELMIDPKYKIIEKLDPNSIEDIMRKNLKLYYLWVGYMEDDEIFNATVNTINSFPLSKKIWKEITSKNSIKYELISGKTVNFKLFNKFDIPLIFTYERLLVNSRFEYVEYRPASQFMGIISKLL